MAQPKPFQAQISRHEEPLPVHAPVLTPEESRQGVISGRVMLVLISSLVLALIAFAIVYSAEIL